MKILIISGFLGSGKTTFIKEFCKQIGKDIAVMENEYGEVGIDKTLLESGELNIWEFTEGCICCSMKSDFASSILTIANTIDPEYLIVEPTGVGKLSNVIENIRKVEYERISLLSPLTLLDPRSFYHYRSRYGDIFEDQLLHTGQIVFSRMDLPHPTEIDLSDVCTAIETIHPGVTVETIDYRQKERDWWEHLLNTPPNSCHQENNPALLSAASEFKKQLSSSDFENTGIVDGYLPSESMLPVFLEHLIRYEYGEIFRAKGFIRAGQSMFQFDVSDHRYSIIGVEEQPDQSCQCIFIGHNIQIDAIKQLLIPGYTARKKIQIPIRIKHL